MPLIITKASASTAGYGLITNAGKLTTYTFPSGVNTFTTPRNVRRILTATGKGSDGVSDYGVEKESGAVFVTGYLYEWGYIHAHSPGSQPYSWADAWSDINRIVSDINAATPGYYGSEYDSYNFDDTTYAVKTHATGPGEGEAWTFPVKPSVQIQWHTYNNTTPQTSGSVDGSASGWWSAQASYTQSGNAGSSTTGFGYTFSGGGYSGGTGSPADTTTYTNIVVTPNTTYTITNNGSLTIQYYT
jgi:hypothetical protein